MSRNRLTRGMATSSGASLSTSGTSRDQRQNEMNGSHKPKNVPHNLWEKFKMLEKRTNTVTQRTTEKRIKHLQNQVMETVTREFTVDEDKDILRDHDVKFGPPINDHKVRKRKACDDDVKERSNKKDHIEEVLNLVKEAPAPLETDLSRPPPPTALEQKIDSAIKSGDLVTAEMLSDHLAERQMGEKITNALDAKVFLEQKKKKEEVMKSQKKKGQLHWGFQHKQRWETKGNM